MKFVKLTTRQKISHYLLALMLLVITLVPLYILFTRQTTRYLTDTYAIVAASILFLFTVTAWAAQKRALRLRSINATKNSVIVIDILKAHGWIITHKSKTLIQATGHGFRHKLDLRTWSELMTFAFSSDVVKINSICNPDDKAQFTSFGKNKQNMADFEILYLKLLSGTYSQ